MSDFKQVRVQQLDPLEEELAASSARGSLSHHALQPPSRAGSSAGCLSSGSALLLLQLLSLMVLAGLLVAVLAQVSRVPSSQGQEQELSKQKVCQELTQLKAGVDRLCRPCPWDWTFFRGHCYFFSKSQRNWNDSVTACQEMRAQLVVIKSAEEQVHGGPHPGLGRHLATGHLGGDVGQTGFQEQGLLPPVEGRRRHGWPTSKEGPSRSSPLDDEDSKAGNQGFAKTQGKRRDTGVKLDHLSSQVRQQ
ncbi:CD209 antigen-like protein A [Marmota flaviventris]|uniref:CD209 antigen-like protein A n=1 Tax=Marmota flaviventris TaxID=93162 RepID=UPI003A8BF4AF